jgi:phage-related minor tail protein
MAKSRVKGITIEIGGNTVGLDKALAGTNKNIGTTQSRLKDVERLLKLDPKNTVLLEQKQKLLAEAVEQTNEKLSVLNKANDNLRDSLDDPAGSAQFDALQREIVETEQKLKSLEKQAEESLDSVADSAAKVR